MLFTKQIHFFCAIVNMICSMYICFIFVSDVIYSFSLIIYCCIRFMYLLLLCAVNKYS